VTDATNTLRVSQTLISDVTGLPTGLAGTGVWVRVVNQDDTVIVGDDSTTFGGTTDYIAARTPSSLGYRATITAPDGGWTFGDTLRTIFDNGTVEQEDEVTWLVVNDTSDDWRPTVAEVGSRLDARTLAGGQRQGTFNEDTIPTGAQVEGLIDDAVAIVAASVGVDVPEAVWPAAKYASICRVAMAVERGFYPSKSDDAEATYQNWLGEYSAAMKSLTERVNQSDGGPRRGARIRSVQLRSPDGLNDPWVEPAS